MDKPETRITVQLPTAVNEAYKKIAKEKRTSKNAVITNVLTENLLKNEKQEKI
jgi:hypothetical protein